MRFFPDDIIDPAHIAAQLHLDYIDPFWSNPCNDNAYTLAIPSDTLAKPEILPSNYKPINLKEIANNCTHLTFSQCQQLHYLLKKYSDVFDGKLRHYPDELIHLDIDPSVKPHCCHAYPIARSQLKLFKQELDRLVKIGVLSPCGRSSWISGTFIISKKDMCIRWISDFRALNKALKCKVYPIPCIQDILSKRSGYAFLTKLGILMQYYTFMLDDESKALCTIATPFGLY